MESWLLYLVGKTGLEPATPRSQSACASQLRHFPTGLFQLKNKWWVCLDLNQGPRPYQRRALTNWATHPYILPLTRDSSLSETRANYEKWVNLISMSVHLQTGYTPITCREIIKPNYKLQDFFVFSGELSFNPEIYVSWDHREWGLICQYHGDWDLPFWRECDRYLLQKVFQEAYVGESHQLYFVCDK